ncbi:sensor domain-containing diguanylate cyclase [Pseudomonas nitroreducens]|uniref:diguanylate cyclase n=1 Tax=Pseudomonas nitroreducens TaxID=46680 RepID=A0A5R9A4Y9_PSENT|nr:sensor domain-containing diguanylate cyclase [Pseudomonas nitroreducens]TLP73742.1 sensor domain-containing diguanylate cyclase [Pseudomonas nitroreducens]
MPYDASPENPVYQTLLESTRAIPWKIDWRSMTFAYIGPQIEDLLGWSQASWVSANDWAERMHPEDRERVVNFCVSQSREGTDHEADYRALTSSGDYVWIRDVVHVVRDDNGEVDSLVGFMFDISERKRAEEQLIMLQRQLEEYSYKDGLTGVANRRMFDSVLDTEWGSAQRSGQPLSLVLLDIDYFKQFNDHYGHIQGDDCLRIVGKALAGALHRPRDFIARFGGEEFVLVLPETDSEAARQIAERCRSVLREQRIAHGKSAVSDLLTISLGVGTAVPSSSDRPLDFVAAVDRLLYQAKQAGRDRLVAAHWSRGDDLRRDAVR